MAMSKSWIIMSRNSPPDEAAYSGEGGSGSREVILISSTAPSAPSAARRCTRPWLWSKRRLNPTCSFMPVSCATRAVSRIFASVRSTGFSQNTCLPARIASMAICACVGVGLHTSTASTCGSRTISI